jgi:hypothetical protein
MEDLMDESEIKRLWAGVAGETVPRVDPSDVKALWELGQGVKKSHPEGGIAIGVALFNECCKPGANVPAVRYRVSMLGMLQYVAPEIINPLIQDKLDAVFLAAAEIPMEWLGEGVREEFPFDADDFVRRVGAA